MGKLATGAMLMCAVFVMVAAAPLVQSEDTVHEIVKTDNGPPSTCALTWYYTPSSDGTWQGHVVNYGMRWLIIDMVDETASVVVIDREMYRYAVYTDDFFTPAVDMIGGHTYKITGTPNGPLLTYCTVEDVFTPAAGSPPVAVLSVTADYLSVALDGSGSYDSDGSIVSYEWDLGDGSVATGMTAAHTYAADGTYTIMLTVTDNDGLTGTATEPATVEHEWVPPVASFTVDVNGLDVVVDASASYDNYGDIASYVWDWGDGSAADTGVTASHTYAAPEGDASVEEESNTASIMATPFQPYSVFGYTEDDMGNPLADCSVTITNVNTGDYAVVQSDSMGWYSLDIRNELPSSCATGDVITVEAVKGALTGEATGTVDLDSIYQFLWLDITLEGSGPVSFDVTITLTVTDSDGQTATATQTVTLYP